MKKKREVLRSSISEISSSSSSFLNARWLIEIHKEIFRVRVDLCQTKHKREKHKRKYLKNNISIILDSKLTLIYCILNIFLFIMIIFLLLHFHPVSARKKIQLKPQIRLAVTAAERVFEIVDWGEAEEINVGFVELLKKFAGLMLLANRWNTSVLEKVVFWMINSQNHGNWKVLNPRISNICKALSPKITQKFKKPVISSVSPSNFIPNFYDFPSCFNKSLWMETVQFIALSKAHFWYFLSSLIYKFSIKKNQNFI